MGILNDAFVSKTGGGQQPSSSPWPLWVSFSIFSAGVERAECGVGVKARAQADRVAAVRALRSTPSGRRRIWGRRSADSAGDHGWLLFVGPVSRVRQERRAPLLIWVLGCGVRRQDGDRGVPVMGAAARSWSAVRRGLAATGLWGASRGSSDGWAHDAARRRGIRQLVRALDRPGSAGCGGSGGQACGQQIVAPVDRLIGP
jgi:hypothetical protein